MGVKAPWSIRDEALQALVNSGVQSEVLAARLDYAGAKQLITNYVEALDGRARVYPRMLPTQASGRWSTTEPPLAGLSAQCLMPGCPRGPAEHVYQGPPCLSLRECVVPDPGEPWLHFDWDAIEAKILAAYCGDQTDLEAFRRGWDIHTVTAIGMYHWPDPPCEPRKALIWGPEGAPWLEKLRALGYEYESPDCRTRRLAKNCRYALAYSRHESAMDRYATEMNLSTAELRAAGKNYLDSKPRLTAWKRQTWAQCWRMGEARTFLGRRRRLYGPKMDQEKQGLNHMIQGSVADMMNTVLVAIHQAHPKARLVWQTHDGANLAGVTWEGVQGSIEREWCVNGVSIQSTAEHYMIVAPEVG